MTGVVPIVCARVAVVYARVNRNGVDAANVEVVSAAPDRDGCKRCAFMFVFVKLDLLAKMMFDCAADNLCAGQIAWRQIELRACRCRCSYLMFACRVHAVNKFWLMLRCAADNFCAACSIPP